MLQKYARCFNSEHMSHTILSFFIMAHHCTKDAAALCWRIVVALCSPAQRMAIVLAAGLRPLHMKWARFADGYSQLTTSRTCSTRALELVAFQRSLLEDVHAIRVHGIKAFPAEWEFVQRETVRSQGLSDIQHHRHAAQYAQLWDKASEAMWLQAAKYCLDPAFKLGLCLLHLTCSITAPHVAQVLLECMRTDGIDCGDAVVLPEGAHMDPEPQPDGAAAKAVGDVGNADHAAPNAEPDEVPAPVGWSATSRTEAYPGMTFVDFRTRLNQSLNSPADRNTLYRAYGLAAPPVIAELRTIAVGGLRNAGEARTVMDHWQALCQICPVLSEVLVVSFSAMTVSTASAEQVFSAAKQVCLPNNTQGTHEQALSHYQNVRRVLLEQQQWAKDGTIIEEEEEAETSQNRTRPPRNNASIGHYYSDMHSLATKIMADNPVIPTKADLRGPGKRLSAVLDNQEDMLQVMDEHLQKRRKQVDIADLPAEVSCMDAAKLDRKVIAPKTEKKRANALTKEKLLVVLEGRGDARALKKMTKEQLVSRVLALKLLV
jgi:hypothetical protein